MHTDAELDRFASLGALERVEVSIFARPNSGWGTSSMPRSPDGAVSAGIVRGFAQLVHSMDDIKRSADHGIRSVLITDIGVLSVFDAMRRAGELPAEMQAKISVASRMSASRPRSSSRCVEASCELEEHPRPDAVHRNNEVGSK